MINKEDLRKVVYALTLKDRPAGMRDRWLRSGFKKINRNPLALITYWENRLSNGDQGDIDLFESVLAAYKAHLERAILKVEPLHAEVVVGSAGAAPLFKLSKTAVTAKISDIIENQRYRPVGYYEDVMSRGVVQGDSVEMPYEEAVSLVEKYSEKNPINGVKNDTAVWGPILWKVLHDRAAGYAMDVDAETRWLKVFQSWIPCGECKSHFRRLLSEMPPDLSSRKNYAQWAVDVHNKVNESLGKPIFSV